MNILITGGLGFQGSHLARRLIKNGYSVTLLTSRNISQSNIDTIFGGSVNNHLKVVQGNILDKTFISDLVSYHDVVFHLAGKINPRESIERPEEYFEINVLGTISVLEAIRKHNKRLFFASSCAVYGDGSTLEPGKSFNEDDPLLPVDPYASSKASADRICYSYAKCYNLDIAIVRPFTTYGPGQKGGALGGLIPIIVEKAAKGEALTIFGDGTATRDFLYIDDLVDAYILLLETKNIPGEVFNVASSIETSVASVVNQVAHRYGVRVEYQTINKVEVKRYAADISKIQSLGFAPKILVSEGISKYIDFVKLLPKKEV